jgi:predicted Zn finger-like uncharacterized protein
MAMLTRCAACSTTFRITTEQLVLRQGKVRCGSCSEVFNALQNLVHSRSGDESAALAVDPQELAGGPDALTADPAPAELAVPSITSASVVLNSAAAAAQRDTQQPVESALLPAELSSAATDGVDEALREPQGKRKVHWWSVAGALLAFITLGAQAAYFYRNEAAARFPETKPWLAQMCQHAGCNLETPRDAQAISIESSDLQADPANRNLLTLVALLRNRAGFGQDAPHLELALTDAQDALVARRVLLPRDYAAPAQFAAGAEIQMRVVIDAGQLKASGYRLYAFYP